MAKGSRGSKRKGVRDHLWNYPIYIKRVITSTSPISFIFIYILLGFLLFTSVQAGYFHDVIDQRPPETLVEGTVGTISSLNPLLITQSQVDRDIQSLIFQKFIDVDGQASPLPSIALSWKVSGGGQRYDFELDDSIYWQDGEKLDADDVVFTFETAITLATRYSKDSVGQSLEGIKIEKTGEYSVEILTAERNATFFESISIYIVPEHRFESVSLANIERSSFEDFPLGSGPYSLVNRDDNMILLERNEAFDDPAKIRFIEYRLYPNPDELETAFRNNQIDTVSGMWIQDIGYVSEYARNYEVYQTALPFRKKIMFINNRDTVLSQASVRNGLNLITDKSGLLEKSGIDGRKTHSTFSELSWAYQKSLDYPEYSPKKAATEFKAAGYTKDKKTGFYESEDGKILTFTLTYLDNDLNNSLATSIKELYEDEGIIVELDPQGFEQMTKETLATRDFELLLYELEITVDPDQYNLWHSLKADYPNLNLSGYNYSRADILLEQARESTDKKERIEDYDILQRVLLLDSPVVVLYEPKFNYVVNDRVDGVSLEGVKFPAERFKNITDWVLN